MFVKGIGCTGSIPNEFCDLLQLQNLYLNDNLISGPLPRKFSQLQHLKRLWYTTLLCLLANVIDINSIFVFWYSLNNNILEGTLEETIFTNCTDMVILDLSCNRFMGRIMDATTLRNLSVLNLSHNHFSGEIPEAFSNLKKLRLLKLHENSLEGFIPSWIGDLVQLKELNLSHNK